MPQQTGPYTAGQYFKALSILCYMLIGGVTIFSIIVLALTLNGFELSGGRGGSSSSQLPPLPFYIVAAVMATGCTAASFAMFRKTVSGAAQKNTFREKLDGYRAAIILRYALLEGPALFSVIVALILSDIKLLAITAILVLLMIYFVPTRQKLIDALDLSSQEADILNSDDGLIE